MNRWHTLPAELYTLVEQTPATVLLESANTAGPSTEQSCSRLFLDPQRIVVANELAEIPALFAQIENAVAAGQFAAGYFTYECGAYFELKANLPPGRQDQPLAWFGIYDRCYLFDHLTGEFIGGDPPRSDRNRRDEESTLEIKSTFALTEQQYANRIHEIHQWIRSGDVYQLNFTVPLRIETTSNPAALYQHLRSRQLALYSAFLHTQLDHCTLSFSPELFFRIEEQGVTRRITTRPMKGTAPRGRTTSEDRIQAEWLANDAKNRAENVMIVDLVRNDLGRVCRFGSVCAESLFTVERYPTLWQMTSTITGELRPEITFQQIFRALFPCGSITGAPKLRAMQLISQLEAQPRGIYTGAIGFFSRELTVFNVAIRTLELSGKGHSQRGQMGVGSGIVIDSEATDEFRECQLKAAFLTQLHSPCAQQFALIETMLWNNGYPLIESHLDRLQDSADYFAFPCDRADVKSALLTHATSLSTLQSHKVRLLLHNNGTFHVASKPLPQTSVESNNKPLRVRIASQQTDSRDPLLFHKTTHRPLYTDAYKAATAAGFDDVLFLNTRGEVTESAIANLIIEKSGFWFTPPIECGLLAGVQRSRLLATRNNIEEKVLYLEDLRMADVVYLVNAVRSLRIATIQWETD